LLDVYTYVDAVLDAAEAAPEGASAATVDEVDARLRDEHIETHSVNDAMAAAYAECVFRLETADLFRK
jgi:hypothetical protein